MTSRTEDYVRYRMRPAVRRQFQPIALRVIAESGGEAPVDRIRQAIAARHPDRRWDPRYPLKVLEDNGVIEVAGGRARFVEDLQPEQIASLLEALDERSVRTTGLRVEDASWRPGAPEWTALRQLVIERDGNRCAVAGCEARGDLELDHVWRGSLLAAAGWSPSAINDPTNLQLLCYVHHGAKTADERRLLRAHEDDGEEDDGG